MSKASQTARHGVGNFPWSSWLGGVYKLPKTVWAIDTVLGGLPGLESKTLLLRHHTLQTQDLEESSWH